MISALTTNVSHFFREMHHFETLRTTLLPGLLQRAASGGRVRIWSAGCSSGQEPYSIAMEILRLDPRAAERDIRILATDIDGRILDVARAGLYDGDADAGRPGRGPQGVLRANPGLAGSRSCRRCAAWLRSASST